MGRAMDTKNVHKLSEIDIYNDNIKETEINNDT